MQRGAWTVDLGQERCLPESYVSTESTDKCDELRADGTLGNVVSLELEGRTSRLLSKLL